MSSQNSHSIEFSKSIIESINSEEKGVINTLNLNANENRLSKTASQFLASPIGEKYYWKGQENGVIKFGNFLMRGYPITDHFLEHSKNLFLDMLDAEDLNLSPLSGIHAITSTLISSTKVGDLILSVPVSHGGHFLTQEIITLSGRKHLFIPFIYSPLGIDFDKFEELISVHRPQVIFLDTSYYIEQYNLAELRRLIGSEVLIIYDASHTLGLISGGQFQSPLKEGADIITANTHKTFPGPHKGIIAFRSSNLSNQLSLKIENFCSSIHCNHLLALAVTIMEMFHWGEGYAVQMIKNTRALGLYLSELGYELRTTSCHEVSNNNQLHVYLPESINYLDTYKHLCENNLNLNFKHMERPLMRIGTQEITRRGMKESDMKIIASFIHKGLEQIRIRDEVKDLNEQFPFIHYSFDEQ
jgi:glycine/serine hydroxymethyltransferase